MEVEEIIMIDGPAAAGRFACLASNKYGATKDVATINYIGNPALRNQASK